MMQISLKGQKDETQIIIFIFLKYKKSTLKDKNTLFIVRFYAYLENVVVRAKLSDIDFEKILKKSKYCTYIKNMFPGAMYLCNSLATSIFKSGTITVIGKTEEKNAKNTIFDFVKFMQDQGLHDGVFLELPKIVNSIYRLVPDEKVSVNFERLILMGAKTVPSFDAVEMVLESGCTAMIYRKGNVVILKGVKKEKLSDAACELHEILYE